MGKGFGELYKLRGIIFFKLSPHEQKAFKGYITHSLPNVFRRTRENIFIIGPMALFYYGIYDWANKSYAKSLRKNPKDFENDV